MLFSSYDVALAAGVLIMIALMILVRRRKVMGDFVVSGWLHWLGWASSAAMALCVVGMGVGLFIG